MGRRRGGKNTQKRASTRHRRVDDDSSSTSSGSDMDWLEEQQMQESRSKKPERVPTGPAASTRGKQEQDRGGEKSERRGKGGKVNRSDEEEPRQCHWIHCTNAAKLGSKYCSDNCGIQLATTRLLTLLPDKLIDWKRANCAATEKNEKEMEENRRKQLAATEGLGDLYNKRMALDRFIEAVSLIDHQRGKDDEVVEEDGQVPCVVCGNDVVVKNFLKHVERCYNKEEKRVILETKVPCMEPTHGLAPIICDFFNKKTGGYCKRIKVLCPEHSKPLKPRASQICGAPLAKDPYTLDINQVCKVAKPKCGRHFNWEKLRRAEIDLQRFQLLVKLDHLREQERQIDKAIKERGNVLALLAHSTVNHELQIEDKIKHHETLKQQIMNQAVEQRMGPSCISKTLDRNPKQDFVLNKTMKTDQAKIGAYLEKLSAPDSRQTDKGNPGSFSNSGSVSGKDGRSSFKRKLH